MTVGRIFEARKQKEAWGLLVSSRIHQGGGGPPKAPNLRGTAKCGLGVLENCGGLPGQQMSSEWKGGTPAGPLPSAVLPTGSLRPLQAVGRQESGAG